MIPLLVIMALITGSTLMTSAEAQPATPAAGQIDYAQLLRELQPRMMFEFSETNLNAYLTNHPDLYELPEGFTAGHIAFGEGLIEVSALTKLLFVPTRVRVSMEPEVMHGRLRLRVHTIHAGPLRLPSSFHHGAADTIAGVVNDFLDHNNVQLISVCAALGLIRISAQAAPTTPAAPAGQ
jgi:hypothetical protein